MQQCQCYDPTSTDKKKTYSFTVDGADIDDTGRNILSSIGSQKRETCLSQGKDASDIEVHDLLEGGIRVGV